MAQVQQIAVFAEPQVAPVREIAVFAEAAGGLAEAQVASVREIAVFAEAQVASVREIAVFADVQVAPRPEAPKFAIFPLERKFVYIYIYIWAKAYKDTPAPANTCSIKKQKEFFSSSHFLKTCMPTSANQNTCFHTAAQLQLCGANKRYIVTSSGNYHGKEKLDKKQQKSNAASSKQIVLESTPVRNTKTLHNNRHVSPVVHVEHVLVHVPFAEAKVSHAMAAPLLDAVVLGLHIIGVEASSLISIALLMHNSWGRLKPECFDGSSC